MNSHFPHYIRINWLIEHMAKNNVLLSNWHVMSHYLNKYYLLFIICEETLHTPQKGWSLTLKLKKRSGMQELMATGKYIYITLVFFTKLSSNLKLYELLMNILNVLYFSIVFNYSVLLDLKKYSRVYLLTFWQSLYVIGWWLIF